MLFNKVEVNIIEYRGYKLEKFFIVHIDDVIHVNVLLESSFSIKHFMESQ